MSKRARSSELRAAIREGYRRGLTPTQIAAATGSTPGSVKVIALRMGVNDRPAMAAAKRWARRTGNSVEDHVRAEDNRRPVQRVDLSLAKALGVRLTKIEA